MRSAFVAKWTWIFVLSVAPLVLAGCGSIFGGSRQKVRLHSIPTNAPFTVFDIPTGKRLQVGMTPAIIDLKRGRGFMKGAQYRIVFESEGHEPRVVDVVARVNGWYVTGNAVIGGIVGWLVLDPITGGMWSLAPNELTVDFEAAGDQASDAGNLRVVTLDQIPADARAKLSPITGGRSE